MANLKNNVNPLTWQVPIVNNNGTPTDEFMRKWGQQQATNATIPDLTTAAGVSARLDLLGSSPGMILERGATAWTGMASPSDATKFLNGAALPAYAQVKDSDLALTDITTNNVTNLKHGFAPKSPANVTFFLNGGANPAYAAVKDSDLSLSDITTNDVSVAAHGFAPKLPNDATKFLNGLGLYSVPAGGGSSGGGAASIQDDGSALYIALSDTDGQLILDGSGDPIFAVDVLPPAALPVGSSSAFGAFKVDNVTMQAIAGLLGIKPVVVFVTLTVGQTGAGAASVILFDTVGLDTLGNYSAATGRFTPNKAGTWVFVSGSAGSCAGPTLGFYQGKLRKNGTAVFTANSAALTQFPNIASESYQFGIVTMNGTTDYVDVTGLVSGAGGSETISGSGQSFMGGFFLGA